jgi:hypothetical protein
MITADIEEKSLRAALQETLGKYVDKKNTRFVLSKLMRKQLSLNRKRVKRNEDLEGRQFQRRSGESKEKMFKNILKPKNKAIRSFVANEEAIAVSKDAILVKHHFGLNTKEYHFKSKLKVNFNNPERNLLGISKEDEKTLLEYYENTLLDQYS